jgi:hypothetical protein
LFFDVLAEQISDLDSGETMVEELLQKIENKDLKVLL